MTRTPAAAAPVPAADASPVRVADAVREVVGERAWSDWFAGKSRFTLAGVELTVKFGSPFHLTYAQRKFARPLREAARRVAGPAACVAFAVDAGLLDEVLERGEEQVAPVLPFRPTGESAAVGGPAPAPVVTPAPKPPPAPVVGGRPRRLKPLGSFVPGPETELALTAAARFAAGSVGRLYLYGPSGVGKTHLLEGAVAAMRRRAGGGRVLLMTAEAFGNLYVGALRGKSLPAFRNKLRAADGLCLDDVDFLDGKAKFQEEFLHTLQEYERLGRPVALTADRHPRLLAKMPEEVLTRLGAGTVCRLAPPDTVTREAILKHKLSDRAARGVPLPMTGEAVRYVAGKFRASVRELEGALCCLETWRDLTGKPVTLPAARKVLAELERDCAARITVTDVERAVADASGCAVDAMRSASRAKKVTRPRMIAMHLARKHTPAALREIGGHFGGRNHATVLSADRRVTALLSAGTPDGEAAAALVDAAEARLLAA